MCFVRFAIGILLIWAKLVVSESGTKFELNITEIANLDSTVSEFSGCYVTLYVVNTDKHNLLQPLTTPIFLFGDNAIEGRNYFLGK